MVDAAPEKRTEFLTAGQLAEVLQVSEATVRRLRRSGRIPAIRVTDRLLRFNLRDVRTALARAAKERVDGVTDARLAVDDGQLSFDDLLAGPDPQA